ncbi:hypothetical protein AYO48_03350 [Gaiella sp. SCGC AG-212-M14]|nr:hypothetical protein AYO48_03350 [Gaiella sp. SCGC AG-212-M14]
MTTKATSSPTRFQIVIPNLNQGDYIGSAIESVLREAVDEPVELVVVDGGSHDGSVKIAHDARDSNSAAKIIVLSEPDDGQSDAINKGMALGRGEIVSWLNADDALMPEALSLVSRVFEKQPELVALYGNVVYIDEDGSRLYELREQEFDVDDLLWGPCFVPQPAAFIARWAWDVAGGVRRDLHYAMDLDLWLRLAALGPIRRVDRALAVFRVHSQSKSVAGSKASRREAMAVRREHATERLRRRPSGAEVEVRHAVQRCLRNLGGRRRGRRLP